MPTVLVDELLVVSVGRARTARVGVRVARSA
jgi:hypothetical protein